MIAHPAAGGGRARNGHTPSAGRPTAQRARAGGPHIHPHAERVRAQVHAPVHARTRTPARYMNFVSSSFAFTHLFSLMVGLRSTRPSSQNGMVNAASTSNDNTYSLP